MSMDRKTSMGVLALAVLVMLFVLAVIYSPDPGAVAGGEAGGGQYAPQVQYQDKQSTWWQYKGSIWGRLY